jgi:anti-sigma factor RsiW
MSVDDRDLRCERVRLLLSLRADGAATPDQTAEADAHVAACDGCRAAAAVDRAVTARLGERIDERVPAGFSASVVAAAIAQRARAAAENRFLRRTAAAAAIVCAVAGGAIVFGGPAAPGGSDTASAARSHPATASARDAARSSVLRPRFEGR